MTNARRLALGGCLAAVLAPALVGAAEAVTYSGSGNYMASEDLMPLASGDAVMLATATGVVAISTAPPSVMDVKCSGLGLMKPDGDFGSVFYCAFTDSLNPEDGFDIKGIEGMDADVKVEVVGGSGKWAGANGLGTISRLGTHSDGGSISFELEIATP